MKIHNFPFTAILGQDGMKSALILNLIDPKIGGVFSLKPRLLYLDEKGKYKSYEFEPVEISVKELGIKSGYYVLDIGSGTGVLLPFVISELGDEGKIVALDFPRRCWIKQEPKLPVDSWFCSG
jgi:protein-L-isoaspartate O-methyltransferase